MSYTSCYRQVVEGSGQLPLILDLECLPCGSALGTHSFENAMHVVRRRYERMKSRGVRSVMMLAVPRV